MLKLICDSREPSTIKTPLVRAGWLEQALPCGDYQIYDSVGDVVLIERKTIKQFLGDMTSGQLQRQARKLVEATDFPILLVEGHWSINDGYLSDTKYTWEQVWNQLATLQDLGCRLQLSSSLNHSIERIFQLEQLYAKEFHSSVSRHVSGDTRVTCLCLVPGIGVEKAKAILNALPNLKMIAEASGDELAQVSGIGAKLGRRICDFFRQ